MIKMSNLCFKTYKETPKEAELISHILLMRAGYIQNVSSGVFNLLPLGFRAVKKIENIIREEMNAIGSQELLMPVVVPAKLWKETGRYYTVKEELLRFKDRNEKDMVLSMTHEEVITDIARNVINSYKQLPISMYQFQTKYRDEARPRGGVIRTREFIMKDAYSFHRSAEDLDKYYMKMYNAYLNIFKRCGCDVIVVESDSGMMGGKQAHEFMAPVDSGEDTIVVCSECDYAANLEVAVTVTEEKKEEMLPLERVHTPDTKTIAALSDLLKVPESKTAKCVFYKADSGDVILAVIRGDLSINETKLRNYIKSDITAATDDDIYSIGAVPGFASPIGLDSKEGLRVIVDKSIIVSNNLVAGANEKDYHILNTNKERDFNYAEVADLSLINEGDICPKCGKKLKIQRAIEVGNIFKLGTKYSESMKAYYLDEDNVNKVMIMGSYGIGLARLLATVIEKSNDKYGIIMPEAISPFDVHIIALDMNNNDEIQKIVDGIGKQLDNANLSYLLDDRDESPGSKFADADLIGMPYIMIIGKRTVKNNAIEVKIRKTGIKESFPINDTVNELIKLIQKNS